MADVDRLVQQLAGEAAPVRRIWPRQTRFGAWMGSATLYLTAGTLALGIRPDLCERLGDTSFLIPLLLALATVVASAHSAFSLSVPGEERRFVTRPLPVIVLATWTSWMAYRMVSFVSDPRIWWSVIREYSFAEIGTGFALALAPGLLLFCMVRRAAPLRPGWAGGLSLLAAGALSSVAGQLTCDSPCPIHAVVLHLSPMAAMGLLGVGAGWVLLRRLR